MTESLPTYTGKPEFIPLNYDSRGKVIDVLGNVRDVEAIPYTLDNVFIGVDIDGSPWHIGKEILYQIGRETLKGQLRKSFRGDLEGKVGFIMRQNDNVEDPNASGRWFAVQLYRVKD